MEATEKMFTGCVQVQVYNRMLKRGEIPGMSSPTWRFNQTNGYVAYASGSRTIACWNKTKAEAKERLAMSI